MNPPPSEREADDAAQGRMGVATSGAASAAASGPLDRRRVARSFDRASASYDAAAALQATVRAELLDRLGHLRLQPRVVLDLGAGTGHASQALKQRYPGALVVALDVAPGMLHEAAARLRLRDRVFGGRFGHPFERVGGDAQRLPLATGSVDLVFSNLMLQWCAPPDLAFAEIQRVLAPGAPLVFSTFGPDTLRELRAAWSAADPLEHVNPFVDMHDLGEALVRAGFTEPVLDVDRHRLGYADAPALMRELKAIGAHNALRGRPRGLTGRRQFAAMLAAYEPLRQADGRLPASWEVIHCTAFAAAHRSAASLGISPMVDGQAAVNIDSIKLRRR
jgi:malonyl-CoA O-methyltransferase